MCDPVLASILADNLIDPKDFAENSGIAVSLECFHYNLPVHPSFQMFTNLQELRIMEQDVMDLDWLKDCPHLVYLNVFHTPLNNAKGLIHSPNLEHLILEGNKLNHIPDISMLKKLIEFNVSENPINSIDEFPESNSLQELSLAKCGLSFLSNSITKLPNLKKLNISANNIHDFNIFHTIAPLTQLQELNLYDPNYGQNPLCNFPNYDVLPQALLPNLTILDTYFVTPKMKAAAINRKKQAELYYLTEAAARMTEMYGVLNQFRHKFQAVLSSIDHSSSIEKELFTKVYTIADNYEHLITDITEFCRLASTLSYKSGGTISITECELTDEISTLLKERITEKTDVSLFKLWKVAHAATKFDFPDDCIVEPKDYDIAQMKTLTEVIEHIQDWYHKSKNLKVSNSIQISEMTSALILCDPRDLATDTILPEYIAFYCETPDQVINQISDIAEEIKNTPAPKASIINNDSILVHSGSFEITPNLVNITLINCGITSLSIFSGLQNLKYLSVPFNDISTLADLPEFNELDVLDVSFNKIDTVAGLLPDSQEASDSIKLILIFGNPICTPKTMNLALQFFPNAAALNENPTAPMYLPPDIDDSVFLTSVFPPSIALESLTSLDFRHQCLVSLAPLSQLPALSILYAADNLLTSVDFKSTTLTFGDFSANAITTFPSAEQFPALETLMLGDNRISKLSRSETLLALFITDNLIGELPTADLFPNLRSLSTTNNPFEKAYPELRIIFSFPMIRMLNGAMVSPQAISKAKQTYAGVLFAESLPKLLPPQSTSLDLSGQSLKDVTALRSDRLLDLNLSSNNLQSIEWSPSGLPKLRSLNLSGNQMQSFEFGLVLPHLRSLILANNKINDSAMLSLCAVRMPQLQQLVLSNNLIKSIESLAAFPQLEELDLNHNFIQKITPGVFNGKLRILDLSYNTLRKLDGIAAPNLQALDLSHNRVPAVDEVEKLRGCTALIKFAFNDNPLAQRISHRIRCLSILRTVREMDGRTVTESDLNQVRIILEQSGMGGPILSARSTSGAAQLPPLQSPRNVQPKRTTIRFPR